MKEKTAQASWRDDPINSSRGTRRRDWTDGGAANWGREVEQLGSGAVFRVFRTKENEEPGDLCGVEKSEREMGAEQQR